MNPTMRYNRIIVNGSLHGCNQYAVDSTLLFCKKYLEMIEPDEVGEESMSKADVAAERKKQIVEATVSCISKFGYHNFSMQDVARTAGVSKGIIHYYFLNKDDLMMSVLDKVASGIEDYLTTQLSSVTDPKEKLGIFIDVTLGIVKKTKEYYQVNMDFWTQINQKEEVRKIISSHYEQFRLTASSIIKEGVGGSFRDVNPENAAIMILGMLDGISLQWLFDSKTVDLTALSESAKSMVFHYLQK